MPTSATKNPKAIRQAGQQARRYGINPTVSGGAAVLFCFCGRGVSHVVECCRVWFLCRKDFSYRTKNLCSHCFFTKFLTFYVILIIHLFFLFILSYLIYCCLHPCICPCLFPCLPWFIFLLDLPFLLPFHNLVCYSCLLQSFQSLSGLCLIRYKYTKTHTQR